MTFWKAIHCTRNELALSSVDIEGIPSKSIKNSLDLTFELPLRLNLGIGSMVETWTKLN
jgi:hypothetical protein